MKRILIFGLPGSGKSTLSEKLVEVLGNADWHNADKIRETFNDWDFSPEGRERQSLRMRDYVRKSVAKKRYGIADFVCPTKELRKVFGAQFSVYMDTIQEGRFEDTNKLFERPETKGIDCDYHVAQWFDDTHLQLVPVIERFIKKQNTTPVGYWNYLLEANDTDV